MFLVAPGCAGRRYAHIVKEDAVDMVGSHDAGAGVWNPLVDEAVVKILSRCPPQVQQVGFDSQSPIDPPTGQPVAGTSTICFIGVENKSAEELVDFKDQIFERIDSQINSAPHFRSVSRRMVDAALIETRLRPDSLFLPDNRAIFAAALGRQGAPVDMLMYATITSGTTDRNSSTQRDYLLTLEMVDLNSGEYVKESAKIRKGYHSTRAGKWWNFGLGQGDG
ncbi:MAG: penicillin-binding protein activator LpoB [Planctomycetaceae bacterium]